MTSTMKNRRKQQEEVRKRDTTIRQNDEAIVSTYISSQHLESLCGKGRNSRNIVIVHIKQNTFHEEVQALTT